VVLENARKDFGQVAVQVVWNRTTAMVSVV